MKGLLSKFKIKNKLAISTAIFLAIAIMLGIVLGFSVYKSKQSIASTKKNIVPEVAGVSDTRQPSILTPTISSISTTTPSSKPNITPKPSSTPTSAPTSNPNPTTTNSPTTTSTPTPTTTVTSTPTPTTTPTTNPTTSPTPTSQGGNYNVKVLNIFYIPIGVNPANNPSGLTNQAVSAMKDVSHNSVNYQIVDTQTVARSTTKKSDGRMDYNALLSEFNICSRLNSGQIDEVWVWVNGGDGAGWEWIISGSINYPGDMNSCGKNLIVMGFDYTRTYDLALHSFGHRMEFLANARNSGEYNTRKNQCGDVHFPPNTTQDYDYSNTSSVQSSCTGQIQTISCSTWGCSQEGYMKWWLNHAPANWWPSFLGK